MLLNRILWVALAAIAGLPSACTPHAKHEKKGTQKTGGYPHAILEPADTANYNVGREGKEIRWVVIHTTEDPNGANCSWARNWFKNPKSGVSTHYVICQDGTIYRMVDDADTAWHAGNYAYNLRAVGVELERHDDLSVSEAQYESLSLLMRWLVNEHHTLSFKVVRGVAPADPDAGAGVIGHDQVPDPKNPERGGGAGYRKDPISFDWERFRKMYENLSRVK
jgi:N-acetyl-anhydromuramyl-L-alanine amidase AmpD